MVNLKYMKTNNFGDDINPFLFKFITGKPTRYVKESFSGDCWIFIGSILNWSKGSNKCWGAGFAYDCGDIGLKGEIYMVRGPLSRQVVLKNGLNCPDSVYGDPALLLPYYYKPNVTKKYKLGIIPHVIEYEQIHVNHPDIIKIDLKQNHKLVIDQINMCESVASSSLHGLIAADAYGVESVWVEFSDKVIGGGFKFRDYYQSIGVDEPNFLNLRGVSQFNDLSLLKYVRLYDILNVQQKLRTNKPF